MIIFTLELCNKINRIMYIQKHNKSKTSVADTVQRKKTYNKHLGFFDNRPVAVEQRKIVNLMSNNSTVAQNQLLQLAKSRVKPGIPPLNPLISGGRKYWMSAPGGFIPGQGYLNGPAPRYKKEVGGREIHATLNNPLPTADKSEELRAYVIANDLSILGRKINLTDWTPNRFYINNWHISIKDGATNVGGWFGLNGIPAALPAYTYHGYTAVAADTTAANDILTNMTNNVL